MATRSFRPKGRPRFPGDRPRRSAEEAIREAKEAARKREQGYRERSLAIHGWICARCAKEFDRSNLHQLTVHHRDGNHDHNPPDGSNWENLCRDCHDAEHSRMV